MCASKRHCVAPAVFFVISLLVVRSHSQKIDFGNEPAVGLNGKCQAPAQCVSVISCPSVLQKIRSQKPQLCGFKEKTPLVCCSDVIDNKVPTTEITNQRISAPKVNFNCGRIASRPASKTPEGTLIRRRRVIGGRPVSRSTLWPWVALVGGPDSNGDNQWYCVASLINAQWLLSAAHCFDRRNPKVVRLGEHDYSDPNDGAHPQDFDIAQVVFHPNYTFPRNYNDLALIRISQRVDLKDSVSPVCLPWGNESKTILIGRDLLLTGWGTTIFGGKRSPQLNEVNMTVFAPSVCNNSYSDLGSYEIDFPRGIDHTFLCMGHPDGGTSACQGDSGGPLMYQNDEGQYILAGTVSSGFGCGTKKYPGVHTSLVLESRLAWIKEIAFS